MIALRLDAGGRVLSIARRTPPSVSIGSQFLALVFTGFEMVYSYPGALIIIFLPSMLYVLGCPFTSPASHFPFCLIPTHRYSTLALLLPKIQDLYSYSFL